MHLPERIITEGQGKDSCSARLVSDSFYGRLSVDFGREGTSCSSGSKDVNMILESFAEATGARIEFSAKGAAVESMDIAKHSGLLLGTCLRGMISKNKDAPGQGHAVHVSGESVASIALTARGAQEGGPINMQIAGGSDEALEFARDHAAPFLEGLCEGIEGDMKAFFRPGESKKLASACISSSLGRAVKRSLGRSE
jgi:hypothetical protein